MKSYSFKEFDTRLTNSLLPCAECGKQPKINGVTVDGETEYKVFCGVHNSCGNWFKNKIRACLDWNKRQRDAVWNPDRNLGELLKPCPFCKKKMVFCRDECVNSRGKSYIQQYYIHEESNVRCVLDEACEVFTIPAGDANPATGEVGEYARMWNDR